MNERSMAAGAIHRFCLYVAGDAQNSVQAIANLNTICKAHLPDKHEIEVVDVFREPKRALVERIFTTPTLVKFAPSPERRIVGTLTHTQSVLDALDLAPPA